jgi:ABC-type bacteriocin/lantibiotic exporter with double-glycine peptidase domain
VSACGIRGLLFQVRLAFRYSHCILGGVMTPVRVIILTVITMLFRTDAALHQTYPDALRCGPNALYMFLLLIGHDDIEFEATEGLPLSKDGVSLLSLRDKAKTFGGDFAIRRYAPTDIDSVPIPSIVQFEFSGSSLTRYHFNVLYHVDKERVFYLDGTTGGKKSILRSRIQNFWTGIAMSQTGIQATLAQHLSFGSVTLMLLLNSLGLILVNRIVRQRYR